MIFDRATTHLRVLPGAIFECQGVGRGGAPGKDKAIEDRSEFMEVILCKSVPCFRAVWSPLSNQKIDLGCLLTNEGSNCCRTAMTNDQLTQL